MLKAAVASGTRTLVAGGEFCAGDVNAMDISSAQIAVLMAINVRLRNQLSIYAIRR